MPIIQTKADIPNEVIDILRDSVVGEDNHLLWNGNWYDTNRTTPGIYYNAKYYNARRIAYILKYGDIPIGARVANECDNPICVNPRHLMLIRRKVK